MQRRSTQHSSTTTSQTPRGRRARIQAILEEMQAQPLTPEQRARRQAVLASVARATDLKAHGRRNTPQENERVMLAKARATYRSGGWPAVGQLLARYVERQDQATDFADVAQAHPRTFWRAFQMLYQAHLRGKRKRNPAGWLRATAQRIA